MTCLNNTTFAFLLLALLNFVPRPAHAAQSNDNCTGFITSVPAVIAAPGTWCLKQNLVTSATTGSGAIGIQGDHVVIDCNDFRIEAQGGAIGTGIAINGDDTFKTTVRNCRIHGFANGIVLYQSDSDRAENPARVGNIVEDNTVEAASNYAIYVVGDGSVVRRNQILNTSCPAVNGLSSNCYAIQTGHSVDVLDNTVSGVTATGGVGSAFGIEAYANANGTISGNRIRNLLGGGVQGGFAGSAFGIDLTNSGRMTIRGNDMAVNSDADAGIYASGVSCNDPSSRASDNVINGFTNALNLCSDAGGNDITP